MTPAERQLPVGLRHYDWRAAALTAIGTLTSVVVLVVVVRDVVGWDFEEATVAPLAADRVFGPRYAGWLGSLGVIGWSLAAGVAALAAAVSRRRPQTVAVARVLGWAAALSALLMLDDLFMIHHTVAPQLLQVPKGVVLLGLLAVGAAWVIRSSRTLLADPDLPMLGWAIAWYALALSIDAFGEGIGWGGVREEAAKLIGVASWGLYLWRVSLRALAGSAEA